MTDGQGTETLDTDGAAAPPRANGELIFSAPWESRLFGATMTLVEHGAIDWEEFRQHLIAAIDRWQRTHSITDSYRYYERWLEALETLLDEKGLCSQGRLQERTEALADRPHGHDH